MAAALRDDEVVPGVTVEDLRLVGALVTCDALTAPGRADVGG